MSRLLDCGFQAEEAAADCNTAPQWQCCVARTELLEGEISYYYALTFELIAGIYLTAVV